MAPAWRGRLGAPSSVQVRPAQAPRGRAVLGPPQVLKPWAAKNFCGLTAVVTPAWSQVSFSSSAPANFRISFLTVCYRGLLKVMEDHWVESPDPEAQVQGCGLASLPAARSPLPSPVPAPSRHPLPQRGSGPKVQQAHWRSLPPVIGRLHPCPPSTPGPQRASEHLLVRASRHSWWVALVLSSGGWALSQSSVPATQTDVGKPIRELCPLEGWDSAAHSRDPS